jgi:NAD(P)-dependent dehydrogenase (short-subunit alcohol dehydrogenase family)
MSDLTALVTGGSRGIGRSIALSLAARGYGLTLVARKQEALEETAALARDLGVAVQTVSADLRDADAGRRCVEEHAERYGALNALVVNAGTGTKGMLGDYPTRQLDSQVSLNFTTPFAMVDAAVPLLRRTVADGGRADIVLLSSLLAAWPEPGLSAYAATKAALSSLARSVNVELGNEGIRAFSICPGYVDTDMSSWVHSRVPQDSMIKGEDVAAVVECLLSLSPTTVIPDVVLHRVAGSPFIA